MTVSKSPKKAVSKAKFQLFQTSSFLDRQCKEIFRQQHPLILTPLSSSSGLRQFQGDQRSSWVQYWRHGDASVGTVAPADL
ncbi:hypothetical protein GTQ43_34105 [Nostoc sp. KVJ3]|nr:hypothetical protein [Nostoc sp. KVJ3]